MKKIHKHIIKSLWLGSAMLVSVLVRGQSPGLSGSGLVVEPAPQQTEPCITPEEYVSLQARTIANVEMLRAKGTLIPNQNKSAAVMQTFEWPLTYNSNFYDNEYYYIQNYIDHDADTNNMMLDYNCGARTYDVYGYNHRGTDICIGPYSWSMMDNMFVNVIAAAGGQIVDKADGNFDRNCAMGGGTGANFIKIMHSDGSYALYFHMKNGSLTTKVIGDYVITGEYLGMVASSGSSTGPHLHFEVHDQADLTVDPWVGSCNPDITTSLWNNQLPYYNPGILRIISMSGTTPASTCPNAEMVPVVNHFTQGNVIRFQAHLRDIISGNSVTGILYDPSGAVLFNSPFSVTGSFYSNGYYYWNYTLAGNAAFGTYKFYVSYGGKSAVHYFTVGCPGAYSLPGPHSGYTGYVSGTTIASVASISGSSSNNVWYEAETYIQGNPGFRATAGCHFRARINSCSQGGALKEEPTAEGEENLSLSASPTIATDHTTLHFNLKKDGNVNLTVYDLTGRKIKPVLINQSTAEGKHDVELSTAGISPGVYLCVIESNDAKATCRIVVQK